MSRIFFTSDLHFSHKNIAKFCPLFRPATESPQELNEFMIDMWNRTVAPEDTVYNLGDVSFAHEVEQVASVLQRLNGHHHLILGNHDGIIERHADYFLQTTKHDGHPLLSSIQHYLKLKLPEINQTLVLFHYPISEWDGCHKGWYHLHGHLHDRMAELPGRILNAGYDMHGRFLTPQDLDDFLAGLPKLVRHRDKGGWAEDREGAKARVKAELAHRNS